MSSELATGPAVNRGDFLVCDFLTVARYALDDLEHEEFFFPVSRWIPVVRS